MPIVTLIMPAYQAARTITRAIESIRAQEFTDWNLIIVDDASTDQTGEFARRLGAVDPRIQVFRNESNLGAASSMNLAWRNSTSAYVAVMDADDAALPTRLTKQVTAMSEHPSLSVLGSAAYFVNQVGEYMRTVVLPAEHSILLKRRWYACPFIHSTVLMRRDFLRLTGGYADGLRLGEDYDLWMRGFFRGDLIYANLQEPLVAYTAKTIQNWKMIRASARARVAAGVRERRLFRGYYSAVRILTEGAIERSGIFALRDKHFSTKVVPSPIERLNKS